LKIPDGASGNVKCPKCGTIFPVKAPAPAFEVVDDEPAPTQKPAAPVPTATGAAARPKPAANAEPDFEVVDEKPKKRVTALTDDDEDDRPRKKKTRDDDDDDRPRGKKRRDDDDEDDRPRKKKKRKRVYDDEDEDDEEDWQPRGNRGAFGKGKVGALLLSISFWLNLGAYGLLALYALIAWVLLLSASSSEPSSRSGRSSGGGGDGSFLDVIVILPGLVGLGAWIVGTIGCSFSIAGPARARGMAITATVFAGLHLVLTGVTFSNLQDDLGIAFGLPGLSKVAWIVMASTLPALDTFLPMLFYNSRSIGGDYIIALLAAVCEVLRLVFALLTLRALAGAAKDSEGWERAQVSMLAANFVVGGVVVFTLLMAVLLAEGGFKSVETYAHIACATVFLTYLAYTAMMFLPAMAAIIVKDACARRA
jgi:hypothetical protein